MGRYWPNQPVDPFVGWKATDWKLGPGHPVVLPKALRWPEFMRQTPNVMDGYGYSDSVYGSETRSSRVVQGQGGYVYQQFEDGAIRIVSAQGSSSGVYLRPGSGAAWDAITREIGPYPSGSQDPIAAIVSAFRVGGRRAGTATAIDAAVAHGPGVVDAAQTYLQGRGDDVATLQRRLANYKAQYAKASGKRQERLGYQIAILEQRLARLAANPTEQAVADLPDQPGDTSKLPRWLPYAALGIAAAGLLTTLAGTRNG